MSDAITVLELSQNTYVLCVWIYHTYLSYISSGSANVAFQSFFGTFIQLPSVGSKAVSYPLSIEISD